VNKNLFPIRNTERLILRKPDEHDWEMVSYLRSDNEVNKYVKRMSAESKEKAIAFIKKVNGGIIDQSILYWVITEKENEEMIGSICIWNFSEDRKTAEVGFDLSPKFQKQGIMDESLRSVLDYGFTYLNLDTITAYTHRKNISSITLLKRNRFTHNSEMIDSNNKDNIILEITSNTYERAK